MANVDKMQAEFDALMKKYDSASKIREWNNAAHGVDYVHNEAVRKKEIEGFKKRFAAAKAEV